MEVYKKKGKNSVKRSKDLRKTLRASPGQSKRVDSGTNLEDQEDDAGAEQVDPDIDQMDSDSLWQMYFNSKQDSDSEQN